MFSNIKLVRADGLCGSGADSDHSTLHVAGNYSVCANLSVGADLNGTQDFCPGSDVDMACDFRNAVGVPYSDSDLLEYQTVYADLCPWMNDDPIWVRNQQATADLTIEWNICASDDAPERMPHNEYLAKKPTDQPRSLFPELVAPDRA
jgi:hypothetical protein